MGEGITADNIRLAVKKLKECNAMANSSIDTIGYMMQTYYTRDFESFVEYEPWLKDFERRLQC